MTTMAFHYLSFAGEEGWRGCTVVEADSFLEAVLKTHRLGINPGGEVAGVELCEEKTMGLTRRKYPTRWCDACSLLQ